MSEAFGCRIFTIASRDFVALAQLFAGRDHPIGEVEHCPFEPAGFVYFGFERKLLKPNLFEFSMDSLAVVFGCFFILKVVHFMLLWR